MSQTTGIEMAKAECMGSSHPMLPRQLNVSSGRFVPKLSSVTARFDIFLLCHFEGAYSGTPTRQSESSRQKADRMSPLSRLAALERAALIDCSVYGRAEKCRDTQYQ